MSDLLPCPFCGGDADLDFWWNENGDGGRGKVICIDCGTEMAGSDHSRPITAAEKAASKSEAVAFWNRRALPAVQPDAEWQPIETAPKNRVIDLWSVDGERYPDAVWGVCGDTEGWTDANDHGSLEGGAFTHWRDRPAPPATKMGDA